MKYSPKYAMQVSGDMRFWSNPERTYRLGLVKVNFECEPDAFPGILILTDRSYVKATVVEMKDPRREFPQILEPLPEDAIAYWRIVRTDEERRAVMAGLTASPIFDDILG
jgi:hypothetical protein